MPFSRAKPLRRTVCTELNLPAGRQEPVEYDRKPGAGEELLKRGGYPHGLTITVATNYGVTIANLPATVRLIETQLAKAGIKLKVKAYPTQAAYVAARRRVVPGPDGHLPALRGRAGFYMQTTLATGSPVNYGAYSNKRVDALVANASAAPQGAARNKTLANACTLVLNDVALIPIINIPTLTATTTRVTRVYDYPDLQLHFDEMKAS